MTREFLKNIKNENRLDKIRLIMKNDDVIGGQPSDDEIFTSNTPFLDIACTMKFAIDEIDNNKISVENDLENIRDLLDKKAPKDDVESALNLKADIETTNINLEGKINKTAIIHEIGPDKTKVASQFLVKKISDFSFGLDQGTFNVTEERFPEVEYLNDSSRPILVTVTIKDNGSAGWSFDVGKRTIIFPNMPDMEINTITFLIPSYTSYGNLTLPVDKKGEKNIFRLWVETK